MFQEGTNGLYFYAKFEVLTLIVLGILKVKNWHNYVGDRILHKLRAKKMNVCKLMY